MVGSYQKDITWLYLSLKVCFLVGKIIFVLFQVGDKTWISAQAYSCPCLTDVGYIVVSVLFDSF